MRFRFVAVLVVAVGLLALPGVAWGMAGPTTLTYTGGEQPYVVPSGVQLLGVLVQGAWGGADNGVNENGAGVEGILPVSPGETLYGEVGQNGSYGGGATFGGGGAAGAPPPTVSGGIGEFASSGGGASDVRTCSMSALSCPGGGTSVGSRVIVAGGGGGVGGGGNSNAPTCAGPGGFGAGADNNQPLPGGDAADGPLPVVTAAGLVVPGLTSSTTASGTTPPGYGSSFAGAGGVLSGCSSGTNPTTTFSDSVAGSSGSGPNGGAGADASGLPAFVGDGCTGTECGDAGPGGGGGGGYFGAGGGATGYDECVNSSSGACNSEGAGMGGAGGSSFFANQVEYPRVAFGAMGTGVPFIRLVPAIEIDTPANGAVYSPGQVIDAAWSCDSGDPLEGALAQNCTASSANGSPIDTSPGTHTFTVQGIAGNDQEPVSATVTYTVTSGGGGGSAGGGTPTKSAHGAAAGLRFTLAAPGTCLAPGSSLHASLARTGSSKSYRAVKFTYYIDRGTPHRRLITVNGKRKTITSYSAALVTTHAGTVTLPLGHLTPGAHTVKLVILLRAVAAHHRPKMRTLTVRLSFAICGAVAR
ncbi:MAG TPA: hypothetical protein VME22_17390 [Solirubrobacteraceae bacterium]|nr:hypothetical protein [Solirubrobacteraceae bacterium]